MKRAGATRGGFVSGSSKHQPSNETCTSSESWAGGSLTQALERWKPFKARNPL